MSVVTELTVSSRLGGKRREISSHSAAIVFMNVG